MITRRKQIFIDNYIRLLNATESAKQAGYSNKTAYVQGSRLLKNVQVKQAVDEGLALKCKESKLTKTSLLTKLSDIINNPDSKHSDVTRAIEVASKILKLYKDTEGSHVALFQQIQHESGKEEEKEPYIPKRNGYIEGEDNTQGKESNTEGIIQGK